jgi:hypothetical protein
VKLSFGSLPAMTDRTIAASVRERVIGPTVSWCAEIGITVSTRDQYHEGVRLNWVVPPAREVKPTVGLMPARLLLLVGQVMLPSVSVPRVTAARPMEAAIPDPEEEPHGSACGK